MVYMNRQGPTQSDGIVICDYGSQYTLVIARKLRDMGIYSYVISDADFSEPEGFAYSGIILSGGPSSVLSAKFNGIPQWVLKSEKPILGVCFGLQLLVHHFGGDIQSGVEREYGPASVYLNDAADSNSNEDPLLKGVQSGFQAWMSHCDHVAKVPECFKLLAKTDANVPAVIAHKQQKIYGLQFHPEVEHTQYGMELLKNFALDVCKCSLNWKLSSMLTSVEQAIHDQVGQGRVLLAVSGGVDSSVLAALLHKALGPQHFTGVLVDNGLLRKGEVRKVLSSLRSIGVSIEVLDRKEFFLQALKGVTEPETKRQIIGRLFIEVFESFAAAGRYTHLAQGTLYPDVIESAGHGRGAEVIKSHHNVGGLPESLALELVEPLRFLFKDEVRRLGTELGMPKEVVDRHPFPGPGLAVRIPGSVTAEKITILQQADEIFMDALRRDGHYERIWQAAAILLPVKSVGVMGDKRTFQWTCVLRAVHATDGMTAEVGELPLSFLTKVANDIVRKVDGINRVLYDVTSKPPATIEWE